MQNFNLFFPDLLTLVSTIQISDVSALHPYAIVPRIPNGMQSASTIALFLLQSVLYWLPSVMRNVLVFVVEANRRGYIVEQIAHMADEDESVLMEANFNLLMRSYSSPSR